MTALALSFGEKYFPHLNLLLREKKLGYSGGARSSVHILILSNTSVRRYIMLTKDYFFCICKLRFFSQTIFYTFYYTYEP